MYGYVVPAAHTLTRGDLTLFSSFYCGLCIRTGKLMGQFARLTISYDMTFLSVLIHDLTTTPVDFEVKKCIANPFKKRAVVGQNELLDKVAALNVILAFHKACDGVEDGDGVKFRLVRSSLKSAYETAKKAFPKADEIISEKLKVLHGYEKTNLCGIDRVSDAFASMMALLCEQLLGDKASEDAVKLCYNIGKFVYLSDALDDIDEDFKAGRYNPFLVGKSFESREKFFTDNKESLELILGMTINRAIECFNSLSFTQSYDLLKKIVYYGLRSKVKELLSSKKKLKKPVVRIDKNERPIQNT